MREYKILLDNTLADIYEEIAAACNKPAEEILQDTLYKVIDLLYRQANTKV